MKKHVQKGFTLIELIIVMALFSLVMYGVLQFLDPVTKFFVRSSNFETTTACIDNMKRAIEGNLKYADRVRAYANYDPSTIDANVKEFWETFFEKRELMDCKGEINVLIFDNNLAKAAHGNEGGVPYWEFDDLSQYNKGMYNSGQISMRTYYFDKTGYGLKNTTEWYVNQKMYANYNYRFSIGFTDTSTPSSSEPESSSSVPDSSSSSEPEPTFNPSDFTITIRSRALVSDKEHPGRWIESDAEETTVASFSMRNVLDSNKMYASPLFDYKVINTGDGEYKLSDDRSTFEKVKYAVEKNASNKPIAYPRYENLDVNETDPKDYFYFIFTQAETVYDAGERVYGTTVGSAISPMTVKEDLDADGDLDGSFLTPSKPDIDPDYDSSYFVQVEKAYESSTP